MTGVQTTLKLDVPERASEDARLKAIIDLVVERFGGDLMAYYNAIRPKPSELNEEEERISLLANRLAKRC
jgi:hypothetical protein